jgi:hypothetical protein
LSTNRDVSATKSINKIKCINAFLEDTIDLGSQSINKATERIHSIFENACNVSLKKKKKKKTVSRKHEVWFDDDLACPKHIV